MANNEKMQAVLAKKDDTKSTQVKKEQEKSKLKKAPAKNAPPKKKRFAFITDIIAELKKVVWPTRQETIRLVGLVIALCLIMGTVLGLLDYGFSELMTKVFLGGK